MASYGIPYQGSKDKLVNKLCKLLPAAENFYDLFGGGFSVTHFMYLHRKNSFKHFYFNEIKADTVQLIKDSIAGKYSYANFKPPWVSRADFFKNKDTCAYTRIIWSFGNNQKGYIFGKSIEAFKRSLHNAVVFNQFDEQAKDILGMSEFPLRLSIRGRRLLCRSMVKAQRLQQVERLEQLQQLEVPTDINFSSLSYDKLEIKPNSVVYCDPPYKNTVGYSMHFDHDKFWQWVRANPNPVFVSEYTAPADIKVIAAFHNKTKMYPKGQIKTSAERLYANEAGAKAFKE